MNDNTLSALLAHIEAHAGEYYPALDGAPVEVRLLTRQRHARSETYRFGIESTGFNRRILVKVITGSREAGDRKTPGVAPDRPRLAPAFEPVSAYHYQYLALRMVYEHLSRLEDARFTAVRPLDRLPELRAIVMESVDLPTLRRLISKTWVPAPLGGRRADGVFRTAGAWLRVFQGLEHEEPLPVLRDTREEVVDAVATYAEFLGARLGSEPFFRSLASAARSHAEGVLPPVLQLGLGHGDFAARNIFVGPHGQVAMFDMTARRRVPIFEDLAYFSVGLLTAKAQLLTFGRAIPSSRLAHYGDELAAGYFGDEPVPRRALAFYELLVLLDRWSSLISGRAGKKALPTGYHVLGTRYLKRQAQRLVALIGAT